MSREPPEYFSIYLSSHNECNIDAYVAQAVTAVGTSRATPRVGFDVKASSGRLVSDSAIAP